MEDDNKITKDYVQGLITGLVIAAIAVLAFLLTWNVSNRHLLAKFTATSSDVKASGITFDSREFDLKLNNVVSRINNDFLNNVDETKLVDGAFKGIMEALDDPYSSYYSADEYKELMDSTNGEYQGIGVAVYGDTEKNQIVVANVYKDTPASEAGIQVDDVILKINGTEINSVDTSKAVEIIKNAEDDNIALTILRGEQTLEINVKRSSVDRVTVASEMLDNKVGYIKLAEFDGVSTNQFAMAVNSLKDQNMEKLVIDIRNNPGGRLDVVCDILDLFVDKGKMFVSTENKYNEGTTEYSKHKATVTGIPICVLVNGNSASASEVFTGVLKDYGLATIVGTQTFGKGIVQQIIRLNDGSAIKLTVSKYYLPNGENIQGDGIAPDEYVELPDGAKRLTAGMEDTQLNKALEILN